MKKQKAKKSNQDTIERIRNAVQRIQRQKKIDKLDASSEWKGLEQTETDKDNLLLNEDFNKFISKFRRLYASGKTMRFKDWLKEFESLIDELD